MKPADVDPTPWCATLSRERGEPMVGTALHVSRFLLVEHDGPWPFHALEAEGLPPDVTAALVAVTRTVGARTLLVRRPSRRGRRSSSRRWAVADVRSGLVTWGRWREPEDLLDARSVLAEPSVGGDGRPRDGWTGAPLVLVCTHGRHDACCAVRGRPLATALAARLGDAVWECSHVGGDRFAGNVVVLPDGTYYGGLDGDEDGVRVVTQHLEGAVAVDALRGRSDLPPVAQVAAAEAMRRWGPAGPRDVVSASVRPIDSPPGSAWAVDLACVAPLPATVTMTVVQEHAAEAAVLTCRAERPSVAVRYRVLEANAS